MRPPHRLHRLAEICCALPEAIRQDSGEHATFTVRKRTFAYYLHDHHGDGIVSVCFKAPTGSGESLVASDEERFYRPAYVGPRGWIGLRLDVGEVDWEEVSRHVLDSYRLVAPKRLAALVDAPPG
jgi:predicted DNA-binding protein (MmcQ/YjbR family)